MKKKLLLACCLGLAACLLCGCVSMHSFHTLLWDSADVSGSAAADTSLAGDADTVTISREAYERYRQFDELLELMDAADAYYYKEPDHQKMLQGASAGLLNGLEDYYTFYYTPEAWEQMWEDDEGEYAGVGILISSNYTTGICTISRVFKGSPAEAAGVRRGISSTRWGRICTWCRKPCRMPWTLCGEPRGPVWT